LDFENLSLAISFRVDITSKRTVIQISISGVSLFMKTSTSICINLLTRPHSMFPFPKSWSSLRLYHAKKENLSFLTDPRDLLID